MTEALDFVFRCHHCLKIIDDWKGACYTLLSKDNTPGFYLSFHRNCDPDLNLEKTSLIGAVVFEVPDFQNIKEKGFTISYQVLEALEKGV